MTDQEEALKAISKYKARVDKALTIYFKSLSTYDDFTSRYVREAFESIREFSFRPAKRIRSVLTMLSYEMYGGELSDTAEKAAIAVELVQDSFLIIDDVMDKSALRRCRPAVHMLYRESLKKDSMPDNQHLGDMLAINVGLLANKLSSQAINSISDGDSDNVRKALDLFEINTTRTLLGQIEDMYNNKHVLQNETQILSILANKCSYYTFISPMQVGAALAGSEDTEFAKLRDFGIPAGIAYQLQDDILGLFGNEESTGKSAESDVREGKITLMMRHAIDVTGPKDKKKLLDTLGNDSATPDDILEVREIVKRSDSLDYVKVLSEKYVTESRKALGRLSIADAYRRTLSGLLDFIISRNW